MRIILYIISFYILLAIAYNAHPNETGNYFFINVKMMVTDFMDVVRQLNLTAWNNTFEPEFQTDATRWIEEGTLLFFPKFVFDLKANELRFLSTDYLSEIIQHH